MTLTLPQRVSYIALLLGMTLAFGCAGSGPSPGSAQPPSGAGDPHGVADGTSLDLETARRALALTVEQSDDGMLKEFLPDLSKPPFDMKLPDESEFLFGNSFKVNLSHHSWSLDFEPIGNTQWVYLGRFEKDQNGRWKAVVSSKGERYFR